MIEKVLRVLRSAEYEMDSRDMADALWLASLLPPGEATKDTDGTQALATPKPHPKPDQVDHPDSPSQPAASPLTRAVRISSEQVLRDSADLFVPNAALAKENETGIGVSRVRVPNAPGLHNALAIARSLRPLGRRIPSRHEFTLDEVATAEASAERRTLTPVFRPERERRFEVALVVEDLPSMALWRRVIAEFHRLLQQQGAFRDVRRWTLSFNDGVAHLVDPTGGVRHASELRHPEARRIVLVVSDCLSAAWYGRSMASMLANWGSSTPVAVMQLLPEHLWPQTAVGPAYARLRALAPSTPNAQLDVERPWWDDDAVRGEVPLPVLALDDKAIGEWSRLLMGLGSRTRGVIVSRHLQSAADVPDLLPEAAVPPDTLEERLGRFRALVSFDAFRLATYLAVVPLTLPVMRLVQSAMFASPAESMLAEVFLGGIIERVTLANARVDDNDVQYEFASRAGVGDEFNGREMRDLLLKSLRKSEMYRVIKTVSDYVSDRIGSPIDFHALAASDQPSEKLRADAVPFANLAKSAIARMGSGVTLRGNAGAARERVHEVQTVDEEVFGIGLTIKRRITLPTMAIEQIAWSPDGKWIALRSEHRGAYSIDVLNAENSTSTTIRAGKDVAITAMVWSPISSEIAYAVNDPFGGQGVYVERVPQVVVNGNSDTPPIIADGIVTDMDWRVANDELSVAVDIGTTQLFRRGDGKWQRLSDASQLVANGRTVSALCWSPDADYLAALYNDGGILVLQPSGNGITTAGDSAGLAANMPPNSPTHARPHASYVAWHPKSKWLVYVHPNRSVQVVSATLQPIAKLIAPIALMSETFVSVSHDGQFVAVVVNFLLLMWRVSDWKELELVGADESLPITGGVKHAAFSPTENTLAVITSNAFAVGTSFSELLLLHVDASAMTARVSVDEPTLDVPNAEPDAETTEEFVPKYSEILNEPNADTLQAQANTQQRTTWDYVVVIAGSYSDRSIVDAGSEVAALKFHAWATNGTSNPEKQIVFFGPRSQNDTRNTLDPSVDSLNTALQSFIHDARTTLDVGERARLVFYFAGDGNKSGDSIATLVLTDPSTDQKLQAIRVSEYLDMMIESNAFQEIAFFADCADRSGVRGRDVIPPSIAQEVRAPEAAHVSTFILMSIEPLTGSMRPFSDALIAGLAGGAADDHGYVHANTLSDFVTAEQARIVQSNASLRPLLGHRPWMALSGDGFVITRVSRRASQVRVTPDRIFEGRVLRIKDHAGEIVSEFTYETRAANDNFVTINPGAYVAEILGLQKSRAFNVYGNGEPVHVPIAWAPTDYRVVIAGTGNREFSDMEAMAATQIGLALAFYGLRVITGGWPGVDYAVAKAYVSQLKQQQAPIEDFLTQVITLTQPIELKEGRIIRSAPDDGMDQTERELDLAHAVIAIGGKGGTERVMRMARERGIPVIPWAATGGDASNSFATELIAAQLPIEREWLSAPITSDEQAGATAERIAALTVRLVAENGDGDGQPVYA